jgi:hypothetical protein
VANERINSTLDVLLAAVRDKLVSDGVFTNCFLSLSPITLKNPPGDQYAIVTPGEQEIDQPVLTGSGRDVLFIKGHVDVTIWNRLFLDESLRDTAYLTDSSLGALKKVQCVINSLTMFDPQDSTPNYLLAEPMRPLRVRVPDKVTVPGWGYVIVPFEMAWTATLAC